VCNLWECVFIDLQPQEAQELETCCGELRADTDEAMESEPETIGTGDTDSCDDDESPSPSSVISGNRNYFWRTILSTAYENLNNFPDTIEELKSFRISRSLST
jgi:hypothetical protein